MGKARVAPLKLVTIPRLELTAAVVAVKIDKMLHQELQVPLQQSIFWTDSTTVLRYIDSENCSFQNLRCEQNLVDPRSNQAITMEVCQNNGKSCRSSQQGLKAKGLTQGGTWINGPEFLLDNECDWSEQPVRMKESLQNDPEIKNGATVNMIKVEENMKPIDKLISYYSDWHKLKRSVAWILKVKENLWKLKEERKEVSGKIRETEKDPEKARSKLEQQMKKFKATEKKSLTLDDLIVAESEIIKFSQRQQFGEEIKVLEKGKQLSRSSQLFKLDPILQDGTLRVGGRLNKSAMPENAKHPTIISKHSRVATLILRDIHQRTGHCGRSYVLAQLRCRYWIPQANSAVRKIINKCTVCRRINGKVGEQKMANLPEDRLLPDKPPFTIPVLISSGRLMSSGAVVQSKDTAWCSLVSLSERCTSKLQIALTRTPALMQFVVLCAGEVKLPSCVLTTAQILWLLKESWEKPFNGWIMTRLKRPCNQRE